MSIRNTENHTPADHDTPGLIVHADDFGLSENINSGIAQAHERGIVTSASIMPTAAATSQAIALSRQLPSLDIGIHLTLVEEKPVLRPESVPSLVVSSGRFHGHADALFMHYLRGQLVLEQVRRELDAQIQMILDRGIPVSHLDSHQHVHLFPGIFNIVVDLARKYRIPAVRLPRERLRPYMFGEPACMTRIAKLTALNIMCRRAKHHEIKTTDSFAGFLFGGRLNRRNLQTVVANLPRRGTCELMCHPAAGDPDSHHGRWNYHGREELEALVSPAIRDYLRDRAVRLISYRDL